MNSQNKDKIEELVEIQYLNFEDPFKTTSGQILENIQVAYETYGKLNSNKDNAILVIHALTGDAHAAGYHDKDDPRPGWWDPMIGPEKALDTNKYFIICTNNLGGCSGTTGPTSVNPSSGKTYGMDFPVVTVEDTVRLQMKTLETLGIKGLKTVIGGSLAGMQTLEWGIRYSNFCESIIPVAAAACLNPMGIAWNKIGRHAIMTDQNWNDGNYSKSKNPFKGLMTARMIAHITYLSDDAMHRKFGRKLQSRDIISFGFDADFQIESYLRYQGQSFVKRFDANSYLYLTRAMDYFDVVEKFEQLVKYPTSPNNHINYLIISFSSDWLFPTRENKQIANILNYSSKKVSFTEIETDKGHDSFLLDEPELDQTISGFLESNFEKVKGN